MSARKRRAWLPWEREFVRANYAASSTLDLARVLGRSPKSVYSQAREMGLAKSREAIAAMAREAALRPVHGGVATRFAAGQQPWNKGTHWVAGGRSAETRFRAGNRPHTWVPVGSYRCVVNKSGGPELQRKINDDPGPSSVRWRPVAQIVWEEAHGPTPPGRIVVFRDGRRTIDPAWITPDALECITRRELMARNTIHRLPPHVAEVARLRGVLKRVTDARERNEHQESQTA